MLDDLPVGWAKAVIGDLAQIETGFTPPTKDADNYGSDLPFFKPSDLDRTPLLTRADNSISTKGADCGFVAPVGTTLVSCIGILGKSGLLTQPGAFNQQINGIFPTECLDPKLVYYWIKIIRSWMEENAAATTVTILNKGKFSQAPIVVPPLPEQHRIVAKLDALQSRTRLAREALAAIPALLDHYRQSLLNAAITGRATSADADMTEVENEVYRASIPSTWKAKALGELLTVFRGASPRPVGDPRYFGGTIPWITIADVTASDGYKVYKTKAFVTDAGAAKSRHLAPGSLILSNSGSVCIPIFLGVAGCIHDGWVAFSDISQEVLPEYLYWYFHWMRPRVLHVYRQGATQVNLNTEIVRSFAVPLPSVEEQRAIIKWISAGYLACDRLEADAERLLANSTHLDQSLLATAFRGELVPQDPADEPASVLLDRIRAARAQAGDAPRTRRPRSPTAATPPARAAEPTIPYHDAAADPFATLLAALRTQGSLASADAQTATGLDAAAVRPLLQRLISDGHARIAGKKRGTRYILI